MKKPLVFLLLGLVLGIGGMSLLNRPEAPPPASQVDFIEFSIAMPGDILSLTHGFTNGMIRIPGTIVDLEDSSISNMIALTARIRDADGSLAGMASELEIFPDDRGPRPGMSWKTDWTITTPQGSLLIYEDERVPIAHLPAFASVAAGRNWEGAIPADISFGPHPSGRGVIVGGTGIYAGATGTFMEKVDLRGLTTDGGISGIMYLQIYLDKPAIEE